MADANAHGAHAAVALEENQQAAVAQMLSQRLQLPISITIPILNVCRKHWHAAAL